MKMNKKLCSVALASTTIVLFLILILSTASAATAQSTSNTAGYAYITNSGSTTVSVIDITTNKVTATINVGKYPYGVAVNPTGTKVYVSKDKSSVISVIDTAKNKVTATVKVGKNPWGVAVNPAGTRVYVANEGSKTVSVIDTATNTVTATVKVGNYPCGVAVNPEGTKVYVTNTLDNTVSVIDTATNKVTATIKVGNLPTGVAVNPAGTRVYVTNEYDVSVIDTAKNKVAATVTVGKYPWGVAVNPAGTKVYVTNYGDGTFSVINTATNKVTATVKVRSYPFGIAFSPDGTKAYVAKETGGTVSVINTATNRVTAIVRVGKEPAAFGKFIGSAKVQNPKTPVAVFYASPKSGKAPLSVKFTDKSTGTPTKWKWSFGDGKSSTEKNPTHKYSATGKYTVKLTVTNAAGSNTATKSKYIIVKTSQAPVAVFYASPKSGKAPLSVKFTDKSTGTPTKWKWSFGDGKSSTEKNPTHKYSATGKYTVKLTVTNAAGSNTATKSKYIIVKTSQAPVAVFYASPKSGKAPLSVKFTDKSTGTPTKWKWSFGDGKSSTEKNPTHKYSATGKYTVKLTVTNAAGSNTATKSKYIIVTETSQAPTADFWGWPLSGNAPLKVTFTETSKGSPTSWKWDFGDGKYSTEKSPTHTYSAAGTYTVKLTATNAAGSSTKTKSNYVKVSGTSQAPTADFWGWPLSGKAPLKVTFTETSKGSPTSWKWDFGDGKYSTEKSPTHTYSTTGTYTVKLTATNAAGSSTKSKWNYIKVAT